MARNFYKKDGSYYYSDNNQKILGLPELQAAAQAGGKEVAFSESLPKDEANLQDNRDFYKISDSYYYADNNQKILNVPELQAAEQAGGREVKPTPETVAVVYKEAENSSPILNSLANSGGSSVEEIANALASGDWSGILDWNGQPFSPEAQQEALSKANEDNKLYYEALQAKDTADAESKLAQETADYQNYLINSGQSFESDKTKIDQQAADRGVLFSGGRVQREKNMKRAYEQDQAYQKNKVSSNIAGTAGDFQYKYGNKAAEGLGDYYKLGQNTYNPNVARGGVKSSGLSSVYNPGSQNFQGTINTERSSASDVRAARYLKNKGNKLLQTGYKNQL